jgi:hypothetical protein
MKLQSYVDTGGAILEKNGSDKLKVTFLEEIYKDISKRRPDPWRQNAG